MSNPVAFRSTLEEAYRLLTESGGEITPEIEQMFEIVDTQKEMALQFLGERRFDREKLILQHQNRINDYNKFIAEQEAMIAHEAKVIETVDKYLIMLIESMVDAKGKPLTKFNQNGQELKVTQGTSSAVIIDDETAIPNTYKRCKLTIPADRFELVKMVLNDNEVKNTKFEVDKTEIKKQELGIPGCHIETTITKHIKRNG